MVQHHSLLLSAAEKSISGHVHIFLIVLLQWQTNNIALFRERILFLASFRKCRTLFIIILTVRPLIWVFAALFFWRKRIAQILYWRPYYKKVGFRSFFNVLWWVSLTFSKSTFRCCLSSQGRKCSPRQRVTVVDFFTFLHLFHSSEWQEGWIFNWDEWRMFSGGPASTLLVL